KPTFMETRQARIDKKKADEMPKDTLAILSLASLTLDKIPAVKSFIVPEEGGSHIAYLVEKPVSAKQDSTASDSTRRSSRGAGQQTVLHLRHLETGEEVSFERVDNYYFSKTG